MASQIKNDRELVRTMKPVFKKVVEYVLDRIMECNQETIWSVVYGAGEPSVYERTGEFAEAWTTQVHNANHLNHDVEGAMFYDSSKMSVGSDDIGSMDYGQHIGVASPYQGVDSRQYIWPILYTKVLLAPLLVMVIGERNAMLLVEWSLMSAKSILINGLKMV